MDWHTLMVPVILRVFGEGGATTDVPVTPETTCRDVVECTRDPGEDECRLVELWRDCERTLREDDHPLEILQEWGCHRDEVRFVLRYTVVPPASPPQQLRSARGHQPRRGTQALAPRARRHRNGGRNTSNDGGMKEPGPLCDLLPEGAGLTLSELREMAGRQQRQIDSQRQLLAAKEQRLLFLKQQDARSHAAAAEQERLRRLRARVDAQEMKLRKLRALRGQVDQQRVSNTALTSDLDSIRALFNEKEKELCMAVAKVEELTRQLEEVKRGRANAASSANSAGHPAVPSAAALELDKLRRELMYRNKLNEQQCQKLSQQRETINARHEEMARIDARISELQERLHRKRLLNQQLASQLSAQQQQQQQGQGSVPAVNNVQQHRAVSRPNIAAVEPFLRRRNPPPAPAVVADLVVPAPAPEFAASKSDPKYQTLPYNTKFAASLAAGRAANKAANEEAPPPAPLNINNNNNNNVNNNNNLNVNNNAYNNLVNLVHSTPAVTAARKGLATGLPDAPSGASSGVGEPPPSQQQQQQQPSQSQQRLFGSSHPSYIPPPPAPSGPRGQPVGGASCPQRGTVRPPNGQDLAQNVAAMVQSAPVKPPVVSTASQQLTSNGHQRLQASSSLPSTPLSSQPAVSTNFYHPNRPVSSVAPSVSSNDTSPPPPPPPPMQKPSPIYQASATKVMIPHPITLSTPTTTAAAANGSQNSTSQSLVLSPPQSTSTPIAKTENDSASSRPRPALPPKPAPPPRLLQQHAQPPSPEGESSPSSPPPPPATEPPVDEPSPLSTPTGITRKAADLPIKARPLTLKKPVAGEQPKLKAAATSRRIEMPPAFLFPETEPPPADLSPPSSGTPSPKEGQDEPDRAITSTNTDEPVKSEGARVEALNNINQEHLSGEQLVRRAKKGGLKSKGAAKSQAAMRRVSFDPLALLLDASLEGELELVKRTAGQVANPSAANDEGITALHNAICAGHFEIVRFLVQFGCDVNAQDSDGWTPLHCAASCNNLAMVKFLVEHGACIFATTLSDRETAAEKCEEDEEGFDGCSEYLYSVQEKLGILNQGQVYAVYDYEAHNPDELGFSDGEQMVVLRKGDELEREWWWSRLNNKEGYVPRNLLGLYPRVQFKKQE